LATPQKPTSAGNDARLAELGDPHLSEGEVDMAFHGRQVVRRWQRCGYVRQQRGYRLGRAASDEAQEPVSKPIRSLGFDAGGVTKWPGSVLGPIELPDDPMSISSSAAAITRYEPVHQLRGCQQAPPCLGRARGPRPVARFCCSSSQAGVWGAVEEVLASIPNAITAS
jgi:hypothetical protein